MFELREKFEKNHFLAILTPQNCNLVGPRRPSGQFSEIRVPTQWNPNFGIVVHCILPLHCYAVSVVLSKQNHKSGIPDFRFFPFASVAQSAGPLLIRTRIPEKLTCETRIPEIWR